MEHILKGRKNFYLIFIVLNGSKFCLTLKYTNYDKNMFFKTYPEVDNSHFLYSVKNLD